MAIKNQNTTQPKFSPILFQPWKVKKILSWDWSKGNMQTRRLAGLNQFNISPDNWYLIDKKFVNRAGFGGSDDFPVPRSPYGAAADLLWVRERFMITYPSAEPTGDPFSAGEPTEYIGRLPREKPSSLLNGWWTLRYYADSEGMEDGWKWRPSIFMPRWASRLNLEVVSTRLERLQDISESDAIAEGVDDPRLFTPQIMFELVWDEINGKNVQYSWASNPWVRVIEYKLAPLVSYETEAI